MVGRLVNFFFQGRLSDLINIDEDAKPGGKVGSQAPRSPVWRFSWDSEASRTLEKQRVGPRDSKHFEGRTAFTIAPTLSTKVGGRQGN